MQLVFEKSKAGREGIVFPKKDVPTDGKIDKKYARSKDAELP